MIYQRVKRESLLASLTSATAAAYCLLFRWRTMARPSRARPYHETEETLTQTSSPGNSPSDKENRHATATRPGDTNKRSQPRPMAPDVSDARNTSRMPPNKRQRLGDRSSNVQSDTQSSRHRPGNRYYDPNQNESERRELRKGLRDLSRELHGMVSPRSWWLALF